MIRERAQTLEDEMLVADATRLDQACRHLLGMVDTVLDLSQVESGRLELSLATFDLMEVLQETAATCEPLASLRGNQLDVKGPAGVECHSDAHRVRQILLNLVGNAIKFTENGQVTLKCRVVGPKVLIDVTDTGIGMTTEELSRVFQPYQQANEGIAAIYGGTGLGLPLSKQLAEALGGALEVFSTPGQGSCFRLKLPLKLNS